MGRHLFFLVVYTFVNSLYVSRAREAVSFARAVDVNTGDVTEPTQSGGQVLHCGTAKLIPADHFIGSLCVCDDKVDNWFEYDLMSTVIFQKP